MNNDQFLKYFFIAFTERLADFSLPIGGFGRFVIKRFWDASSAGASGKHRISCRPSASFIRAVNNRQEKVKFEIRSQYPESDPILLGFVENIFDSLKSQSEEIIEGFGRFVVDKDAFFVPDSHLIAKLEEHLQQHRRDQYLAFSERAQSALILENATAQLVDQTSEYKAVFTITKKIEEE